MKKTDYKISGNIVDVVLGRIFPGTVVVENGKIVEVRETDSAPDQFILPGLIDAHIHIESSMLIPSEFARLAVLHGTVATVSDPHEIANVLGVQGVRFMIENGKKVPFKFYFGAPSCVPATIFETAGASLGVKEVEELLQMEEIKYLSEMMNFPGVLFRDNDVMAKLELARRFGKPVDGHAPGVTGESARQYIEAGITTDHECFTIDEAREKIRFGMNVLLREGSAAKNFEALYPLMEEFPDKVMLCSDDKHPDDLLSGHINREIRRAVSLGIDPMKAIRCCTLNPVRHYNLEVGLLRPGDSADFILVDDLAHFNVLATYIEGTLVAEKGISLIDRVSEKRINNFNARPVSPSDLHVVAEGDKMFAIDAWPGQLITGKHLVTPKVENGIVVTEPDQNLLKIVVLNRYQPALPAIGFIRNFGLTSGAIASSVAHDSHNIVAVGADDDSISRAINLIINAQGGISWVNQHVSEILPLPVAGIMSDGNAFDVAAQYARIDREVKNTGVELPAPFMTLSFMALLVIPELKLSDKGLFDGNLFRFTSLFPQ